MLVAKDDTANLKGNTHWNPYFKKALQMCYNWEIKKDCRSQPFDYQSGEDGSRTHDLLTASQAL